MRYIQVPEAVPVLDPLTDEPMKENGAPVVMSFAKFVRVLCVSLTAKGSADTLTVLDIRAKFDAAPPGACVEVSEEWWKLLEAEARRPTQGFTVAGALSAGAHIRAVLRAPEERPAVLAASAPS